MALPVLNGRTIAAAVILITAATAKSAVAAAELGIATIIERDTALRRAGIDASCVLDVASHYRLDVGLLLSIVRTEGGRVGERSFNKNGTADFGPAQINSTWIRRFRERGIPASVELLENNACFNLFASGWILRYEIDRAPDIWTGIGNYHSRTKKHHQRYIKNVHANWLEIYRLASTQ